ncbi:RHS repeat-associated core domain-containing protein, partial [Pseudodesulfovibrio sp.]|uniref:RHS repeat domain-containing protein n=1 Tax=Pseudodesulfovibrio sp. TaxID=2035812 RepID=UPI002628C8E4
GAKRDGRTVCDIGYDREGRRSRDYFPHLDTHYRNFEYSVMDNWLRMAGNNMYTHDKNGFRSIWNHGGQYTLYEYGTDYRLLKAEKRETGEVFEFTHDDQGRRSVKYRNGRPVEAYRWLDFLRLDGFHDGESGYRFAYGEGERIPYAMQREDGAVAYLFYDQVGSLRVVANADGEVIKEVLYDPFGGIIEDSNPGFRIPIGFAGGLHDRDLGFVRFGWRDYDTFTDRWTAPDPLGDKGGDPDWYGYCLDDPVNGVDPMGLFAWVPLAGAAIGAGSNAYDNWDDWRSGQMSTGDYAKSVGLGAATGAVSTMGGGMGSTLLFGGGAAALNEAGSQYIKKGKVDDVGKVAVSGISGAAGGALGKAGKAVGKKIGRITPPKTIPPKPLKDASNLGGVVGSTFGSEYTDSWLSKALGTEKREK